MIRALKFEIYNVCVRKKKVYQLFSITPKVSPKELFPNFVIGLVFRQMTANGTSMVFVKDSQLVVSVPDYFWRYHSSEYYHIPSETIIYKIMCR